MTLAQAEAALRLWGEAQKAKRAGDDRATGYRRRAAHMARTRAGVACRSEAPDRPGATALYATMGRVDAALKGLAGPLRRIVRLVYAEGWTLARLREDELLGAWSLADLRAAKGHAIELVAARLGG